MSLIDLASLVLAPTATKEGKVYSAIPDTGEGDMTFTRGSSATRVNSAGLIEKERANLLLQSNTFDTTWSTTNTSVTGGQSGYDGSSDAWLLNITGGSSDQRIFQSVQYSGVSTLSVYAKKNDSNWLSLRIGSSVNKWYDLENGVLGDSTIVTAYIDASIEDVGNGWYRCSLTFTDNFNTSTRIYPAENNLDITHTSGSIYIQDAMLNEGLVAQPYIETTTTAVYEGITDDVPRVDYSGGGCPSLLLEPQRSNLMVQSEAFSTSAWTDNATNTNVTANATISPEGVQNASEIEFTNTNALMYDQFTNVASSLHIASVWLKNKDIDTMRIRIEGNSPSILGTVDVDLVNGTLSNPLGDYTPTIKDFGNGWYRVAIGDTGTATVASPIFSFDCLNSTGSFYAYGAMVEAGSYVSSYIPTYGTSTSRSADSCSLTNASNLIGQSEGTLFCDFVYDGDFQHRFSIANNANTDNWIFMSIPEASNGNGRVYVRINSVIYIDTSSGLSAVFVKGQRYKVAFGYQSGDWAVYINGLLKSSGSETFTSAVGMDAFYLSGTSPTGTNQLSKANIDQAILFPTRLTNDQLQELTK